MASPAISLAEKIKLSAVAVLGGPVGEAVLVGVPHGLGPVAHPSLGEQPVDVRFHRRLGDEQPLRDLHGMVAEPSRLIVVNGIVTGC